MPRRRPPGLGLGVPVGSRGGVRAVSPLSLLCALPLTLPGYCHLKKKFFLTSIYLLGCARSWLQHAGSLLFLQRADSLAGAWRIWFHDQGSNPGPPHWGRGVLATGSPGTPPSPPLPTAPLGRAFRSVPSPSRDWRGLSLLLAYLVPAPAPVLFLLPETLPQSLLFSPRGVFIL